MKKHNEKHHDIYSVTEPLTLDCYCIFMPGNFSDLQIIIRKVLVKILFV